MKRIHLLTLSVLSGLLLSAAWPVHGITALIFVAFVPLFFVQEYLGNNRDALGKGHLFLYAFVTFLIWNSLTTYWIWNSTPGGGVAAIGLNSIFMASVFWMYHYSKTRLYDNKKGSIIIVFFWLSFELLHQHWDLNWPWLALGHAFSPKNHWIQWYEFTGVPGGTVWVLLMNLLAFQVVKALLNFKTQSKRFSLALVAAVVLWMAPVLFGEYLYRNYIETGEQAEVIVVQPNFDPYTEQYELSPAVVIERNLTLAASLMNRKVDFVVCPESAIQESIWLPRKEESPSLNEIKAFVHQHPETAVVIGASTFGPVPEGSENDHAARKYAKTEGYYYAYNTAFMIDTSNQLPFYHKSKLTPGVEMMPSWFFLRPLSRLAIDLGGTVGTLKIDDERRVFVHPNGKFRVGPMICYESVYGEFVSGFVRNGANLLFIITNDGWWGNTPGHRQHMDFAILRAIETRRSIARSANTGISAFVDQRGDVFQKTPYWEQAVIRQAITTNDRLTFYVRYGDYLSRTSVFIAAIFLLTAFARSRMRFGVGR